MLGKKLTPDLIKLQDNFIKSGGKFKDIRIGELFDIHPTKSYGLTNYKLFKTKGKTPVIVNSSLNNGIGGFVDLKPTEKGNMITYSDTTTSDAIFYQPNDFIGYSHVQGLYPYEAQNWDEKAYLYFLVLFKKSALGKFNYANKFNRNIAKELVVKLPFNKNNKIDFDFMRAYISQIEDDSIIEMEDESIKEIKLYLKSSGLENYELSSNEKKMFNNLRCLKTASFKIGDLFEIRSSKKKFNANAIKFGGKFPYVARGSNNNGIRGYITESEQFLNDSKTISFGQDTATIFYQEKQYFTGDKIKILTYKYGELNQELACYLISCMKKEFEKFSWGQNSFNENIIKNIFIILPVNSNNEIDFEFMENYIKVIEKLTIKSVVECKNKIIKTTKEVIHN